MCREIPDPFFYPPMFRKKPDTNANPKMSAPLALDANISVPRHIAIIMDGNGRWAKERNKPRNYGHHKGADSIRKVLKGARKFGVEYITLYAFSSENWSRPKDEVNELMKLLTTSIKRYEKDFVKNQIRFLTIGDIASLPKDSFSAIEKLKKVTEKFTKNHLILALNYGSRDEVLRATKAMLKDVSSGKLNAESLDWEKYSSYLDTANIPDPDLLIRTSGEQRLSNYLMLQAAYAELYFTGVYWPDFDEKELEKAILEYSMRERRYGKTGEQLK